MKIINLGISAVLGIMIIVIMAPFASAFSDSIVTVENNDGGKYALTDVNDSVTFELINGHGYINGERIRLDDSDYTGSMIMFSDTFVLSYNGTEGSITSCLLVKAGANSNMITKLVTENGTYTATYGDNQTVIGTFGYLFSYDKDGEYIRVNPSASEPAYVNADSVVYSAWASSQTDAGLIKGTINNLTEIFNNGGEREEFTITYESINSNPEVYEITGVTAGYSLFIPVKYSTLTFTSETTRMLISLTPLFTGIGLFAFMGIGLSRISKF